MKKSANEDGSEGRNAGEEAGGSSPGKVVFEPGLVLLLRSLGLSPPEARTIKDDRAEPSLDPLEQIEHDRALELFSSGAYFEAHEHWESIWRNRPPESRARHAFQALIRLCAAGVKLQQGHVAAYLHHLKGAQSHLTLALAAPWRDPAHRFAWKTLLDHLMAMPAPNP